MNHAPDWLWQGIAANLLTDSLVAAGWLAWKHRKEIAQRLQPPRTIRATVADKLGLTDTAGAQTLTGGILSLAEAGGGTLTVSKDLNASWNVLQAVEGLRPKMGRRSTDNLHLLGGCKS
jgi:hypothetical protein